MAKKLTEDQLDVLAEVNRIRAHKKLKPLTANKALEVLATTRAKYIFENDDFSHTPKQGLGYKEAIGNKDYSYVGENLARKFPSKKEMIKAWYRSPTHKKNMLENYDETGIGTFGNVTVQLFGRKYK